MIKNAGDLGRVIASWQSENCRGWGAALVGLLYLLGADVVKVRLFHTLRVR